MEPLWFRLCDFAREQGLSFGLGVDSVNRNIVAHVGRAMGVGPTSNEAINRCADQLPDLHAWEDDRT